jgi:glycosyltransferase involved in cell wall biosynthesis
MISYPKITIITPTFNRAEYLEETILSVINQNYPNLDYIIVDGGSTDRTAEIIKKYESHLSWWISEPDKGMYYAIQKGFDKSSGEIMAWLNSDDKYHEGALHNVAQIFSDLKDIEWIIGIPTLYNRDGRCVKVGRTRRWSFSRFQVGDYRWIQQESVFWKRSLWEKAGNSLDLSIKYAADFELWCRFFKYAQLFSVETSLSGFRLHSDQISIQLNIQYENEVSGIIKSVILNNNSLRYGMIKIFYSSQNFFVKQKYRILKLISTLFQRSADYLHHFPDRIYYDFKDDKWVLKK